MRTRTPDHWRSAGRTDIGRLRQSNQDALLLLDAHGAWIVADGMGGHAAGDIASRIAVETIATAIRAEHAMPAGASREETAKAGEQALIQMIRSANDAVRREAATNASMAGMGTTLTVLRFYTDPTPTAMIGHVGDSRVYLVRSGTLHQVSQDHSLVEEYRRIGRLSAEEALSHPLRHVLSRAVGPDAEIEPDTYIERLQAGDRFLMCTDGLTKMLTDGDILNVVTHTATIEAACEVLVAQANARGGEDNITVAIVEWLG